MKEEALAHWGAVAPETNKQTKIFSLIMFASSLSIIFFFYSNATTCPFVDFVVLPPGHGRSVNDFSGWDAHEAQLRCPDGVSGDIGGCSARRGLKPKFY